MPALKQSVFLLVIITCLCGCRCKTENFECPAIESESLDFLSAIENTNFIFESDSGRRLILKTVNTRPEKEQTQTCSGTRNNCDCQDCHASTYFNIHVIDTSEAIQFWYITFLHQFNLESKSSSAKLNIETVTFETQAIYPFVAGTNVQEMGDLTLAGKIYKEVFRVEIQNKISVNEFGFVMFNQTHGIVAFKEINSEEIFYRL